jgi:hypothetical protein
MAVAHLYGDRWDEDELPDVCMRCGAPATTFKKKQFAWHPPWVVITILAGLLVYVILALVLTQRRTVAVPLCDRHRHHWLMRGLLIVFSLVGALVLGIGTLVAGSALAQGPNQDAFIGIGVVVLLGGLLAWIVLVAVAQHTAIRPTKIDHRETALANVSRDFVNAYQELLDRRDRALDRRNLDRWEDRRRRADDRDRYDREEDGGRYRPYDDEDGPRRRRDRYRE